jgi:phage gp29-like protein
MTTDNTPTTKGLGKEIGQTGTAIYKGIITLEEYNNKMRGRQGLRLMDVMRRSDATVRATLQVCKLPILSTAWSIQPASDDKQDIEIADFVRRELMERNIVWHDFLREGLTMFDFGHSVAEKVYEMTEFEGKKLVGIKKISYRKQTTIQQWELANGQPGIRQLLVTGSTVEIPMQKLIVFIHDKEGDNYEGVSLLRYAYKHWDIKDKLDRINAVALEKQGVGVPLLKHPADADQADIDKARAALRQFRANEEAYQEIPMGWELEMLDMKASTTKEIIPSIQYHDRQITMSVLAQFLTLGGDSGSGSRAVSQDHSKLFLLSEEATAKNLQTSIQEQLIKQLCDLNFSNLPNGYPKLQFAKIGDEDIATLADAVQKFTSAGVLTAEPGIEKHVRSVLHLPELPEAMEKAQQDLIKNPPKTDPTVDADPITDEGLDDDGEDEAKQKKQTESELKKKQAIRAAQVARKNLIDVITG